MQQASSDYEDERNVTVLQDIFPDIPTPQLLTLLDYNVILELAIEEILSDPSRTTYFNIEEYFKLQMSKPSVRLDINREDIWKEAGFFYKCKVDPKRPLQVSFGRSSVEMGIDAGGPKREFFQLLATQMSSSNVGLFEGEDNCLLPFMKGSALRLGHFKIVGSIIAHSIINGGVGFPFLAPPIFEFIVNQDPEAILGMVNTAMVPDRDSRAIIDEISRSTEENFNKLVDRPDVLDYICKAGWTGCLRSKDKEHIVATLLLHEIIWKRQCALNQLIDGLNMLDLMDVLRRTPHHFREKFVRSNVELTGELLLQHMYIEEPYNQHQERSKSFLTKYIEDNKNVVLGHDKIMTRCDGVLQFATGNVSLGGSRVHVAYCDDSSARFPSASTCTSTLILPVTSVT